MVHKDSTETIQAPIPTRLLREAYQLVDDGWFADFDELLVLALRRFLEAHRSELAEQFVQEDVAWGLHGDE